MKYTIKKLAKIAGISVRALYWYEEIGILKPAYYGANGYRYYEEHQLLLLQQILFFRELGFTLLDIKKLVAENSFFDKTVALRAQRTFLTSEAERINKLIATVDNTLLHLSGEKKMSGQDLFDGFEKNNLILKAGMQNFLDEYSNNYKLSGNVLISVAGDVIISDCFNAGKTKNHEFDSKYMIGSITMQFISVALLNVLYARESANQLHDINNEIHKYLNKSLMTIMAELNVAWPEIPEWANHITIHHLLTNTSGIPNFNYIDEHDGNASNNFTSEFFNFLYGKHLDFKAGAMFSFSNSNYILIAIIIEHIIRKPLNEYLVEEFFVPLQMKNTFLGLQSAYSANHDKLTMLMPGHCVDLLTNEIKIFRTDELSQVPFTTAAIDVVTTSVDLMAWNNALYTGNLIPDFLLKHMTTAHVSIGVNDEYESSYGYGTAIVKLKPFGEIYMHNSHTNGNFADLVYIPALKLSIVCLSNISFERTNYKIERENVKSTLSNDLMENVMSEKILSTLREKFPNFDAEPSIDAFPKLSYNFIKALSSLRPISKDFETYMENTI